MIFAICEYTFSCVCGFRAFPLFSADASRLSTLEIEALMGS